MRDFNESSRRKAAASGLLVGLADGDQWLLAIPSYRADASSLTEPDVDGEIDRLFERSALTGEVALVDVRSAAKTLLLANYEIDDEEIDDLTSFESVDRTRSFVSDVLEALFGASPPARAYTDWVRAGLIANGIGSTAIRPGDLANVLAILIATNRMIPASRFVDASRAAEEQAALDGLV